MFKPFKNVESLLVPI